MKSPRVLQKIRTFREDYERAKANAPTVTHAPEPKTQEGTTPQEAPADTNEGVTTPPDAATDAISHREPQIQSSVPHTKQKVPPSKDGDAAVQPAQVTPVHEPTTASAPVTNAETPTPATTEMAQRPTTVRDEQSDVADRPQNETETASANDALVDVPDLEAGTIITDKRTTSFRLIPALIDSLRNWWMRQQNRIEDWRTPEHTVTPATERKDIVEKAASQSALAPRDDYEHVSKRLQAAAPATPIQNEVQIKSADEVPAPHWKHTTDTAAKEAVADSISDNTPVRALLPAHTHTSESDNTEPPHNDAQTTPDSAHAIAPATTTAAHQEEKRERAADADTSADIPTTPHSTTEKVPPEEKVSSPAPPSNTDSTVSAPTQKASAEKNSNWETDSTPTPVDKTSLPTADTNTQAEVPRPSQPPVENREEAATSTPATSGPGAGIAHKRGKRLWFIVVAIGATVLGLGVSVGVWMWITLDAQPEAPSTPATPTALPRADMPVAAERQSTAQADLRINTAARGAMLLSQIKARSNEVTVNAVTPFAFTQNQTPYSNLEIISRLGWRAPEQFLRNLEAAQIGLHPRGIPYIALRLRSYEIALGGMLQWEDNLVEDLAPLFENVSRNGTFQDEIINNRDVRIYHTEDGTPHLLYVLLDERTVLITGDVDILGDLIRAVRL